ncbi:MAG: hypothetical protein WAV90_03165, partial [Gordonia amarae]
RRQSTLPDAPAPTTRWCVRSRERSPVGTGSRTAWTDYRGPATFIGAQAEKDFGRRHFMELLAVFTAPPEFRVFQGRTEIGMVDTGLLTDDVEGRRVLLLVGRSWKVTHIDWKRRQVFVEATDIVGMARWQSTPDGL